MLYAQVTFACLTPRASLQSTAFANLCCAGRVACMLKVFAAACQWLPFLSCRLALLASVAILAGCGEPNPLGRRAVYGAVTFQGQPVDYGGIQFLPEDPQRGVNSGGMIDAGKYQIKESQGLPPGAYRVMISSPDRREQTKVEEMPGDVRTLALERIPVKYNLQTTLKIEVPQARGAHQQNFELK